MRKAKRITTEFNQLCVWPATMLGEETPKAFEKFMQKTFDVRVMFAEEVVTIPRPDRDEEGGRHDLLFYVHDEDITKFAIPRFTHGIRWWEDAISNPREAAIYAEEVLKKYSKTW